MKERKKERQAHKETLTQQRYNNNITTTTLQQQRYNNNNHLDGRAGSEFHPRETTRQAGRQAPSATQNLPPQAVSLLQTTNKIFSNDEGWMDGWMDGWMATTHTYYS